MCGPSGWGHGPLGSAECPSATAAPDDPRRTSLRNPGNKRDTSKCKRVRGLYGSSFCHTTAEGDSLREGISTQCLLREYRCPRGRTSNHGALCDIPWCYSSSQVHSKNGSKGCLGLGNCRGDSRRFESPSSSSSSSSSLPYHLVLTTAFVFLVASLQPASAGLVLSDHIRHFEPVFYDESHLRSQHHRAKRDANHVVRLHFNAHNRLFKLRLRRDASIFADDVVFESSEGPIDFDFSKVYSGTLEDDHLAQVEGVVTKEGLFDGHVATPNELYYLEPASRYLEGAEFHSVMYKASDVEHPALSRCSSQQLHLNGRVHTPWGPPQTNSLDSPFEPLDVPMVGPERSVSGEGEDGVDGGGGGFSEDHKGRAESSSLHSSIASSAATTPSPRAGGAIPSPELQDVNPKHKAVTHSKNVSGAVSDNASPNGGELPGASFAAAAAATSSSSPLPSSTSSSSPASPSASSEHMESLHETSPAADSNSLPTSPSCYKESICRRRSNTSTKRSSTFDKKSSHFVVKKFKKPHFQDSANAPSPAGAQPNAAALPHTQHNTNKKHNKTSMASPRNTSSPSSSSPSSSSSSSSAPEYDSSHVDFELVYELTGENKDALPRPSWNFTRKRTGVRPPPALPQSHLHYHQHQPWYRSARKKRASIDPQKTTCMLYLQADHLFYEKIGSEEACIDTITRHVQRVNNIYKVTDFDSDKAADKIGFMIKRIKIHTSNALNDPSYRFPANYGVEKFLELFSEEDYDAFCLAYMFTYRDFEGGTLGLAWTGDLKNAGGVCEKNGHYRGSLKSLNTGIVTLLNYGKHVPPAVSHVTLAHEIGHNFGSPHDPESDTRCTPGGPDGNYIMYARATSGDKQNNNKFSPCSLRQINSVLNTKARDSKGCFTQPQAAICGNGVVEAGEECDCGWEEDCEEACCYPMKTSPKKGQTPCTLRPNKTCSPSQVF